MPKNYYVYIMSNRSKTLYIGVTNDLYRRVHQHKNKINDSFTAKYNITMLVYYEHTTDVGFAIMREKQLKNWHKEWKINLIESMNKNWDDLAVEWF